MTARRDWPGFVRKAVRGVKGLAEHRGLQQSACEDEKASADPLSAPHDKGFVLVSVIWISSLLAVAATTMAILIRSHTLSAITTVEQAQLEAIADGMVRLTAWRLANSTGLPQGFKPDGTPFTCQWSDDVTVTIAVQDQGSLIDLNTASPPLLHQLLTGAGLDARAADAMASDIADYRDADHEAQAGGPEPDTYPGKTFGPKNGPFEVVEELDQIPGMTRALYKKLRPLVTVYSQQTGVDPDTVPADLAALLGLSGAQIPIQFSSPSGKKRFAISARAAFANGAVFRRESVLALTGQQQRPVVFLTWQEKAPQALKSSMNDNIGKCY